MATTPLVLLEEMRNHSGPRITPGLPDDVIERFARQDPTLVQAIEQAAADHRELREAEPELLAREEADLRRFLQRDYVNFYADDAVNPYVALAAKGPWLVTTHGAVLHDNGGYGMLGFGHAPDEVLRAMARPWVMANVMTPSVSHHRFGARLRREIGHTRGTCPYDRFLCLNSGSESVTLAARIADINCALQTGEGGRHAGKPDKYVGLVGGFHGRTYLPARASHSTARTYARHLKSFRDTSDLLVVPVNDIEALRAVFQRADDEGFFIEMMLMEPVQGEGSPGTAITRAFYDEARRLTAAHGSLLLIDSIQAGLRGTGALSIVDYPGFEDAESPDMETYSKALNGGQYPLSVLACNARAASLYQRGVYGNTMTANPRALEVGCAVLDLVTPEIRANIRARGRQLVEGLKRLQAEMPELITQVQGTGLLCAAELNPELVGNVVGPDGIEVRCRKAGLGVIHGGRNALRFTPHFRITEDEVDLIVSIVGEVLRAALEDARVTGRATVAEPA